MTDEQRQFAEHVHEAFVQACPGAGKTKTIIVRLAEIAKSLPPRRGVAVLSFTNKAIEEFRTRSSAAGVGAMLRHPGFIGTFDAFVRHFLFSPTGVEGNDRKPQIVDSWDSLDVEVRLQGSDSFAGSGVSLDLFDADTNEINPTRITNRGLKAHVTEHRARYQRAAQLRRQHWNRLGFYSASDARAIALRRIRDPAWAGALGRAISGRFQEIIVDEAQDCNPLDLEVLSWLRRHGVKVTLVCDMDQSIYAFRDGDRRHLEDFAESYRAEDRLTLTGNFRSSRAICLLAASLRGRVDSDTPLGDAREVATPIAIYSYKGQTVPAEIGQWFAAVAESEGINIPRDELIILAHSEKAARLAAGGSTPPRAGQSRIERLARAIRDFWSGTTNHSKSTALGAIEKLLLDISGRLNQNELVPNAMERLRIDGRQLRRQSLEVAMRLPRTCANTDDARTAWIESARAVVGSVVETLPAGMSLARALPSPSRADWAQHLSGPATGAILQHATIHNAKGGEYSGVCVVVPPDDNRRFTTDLMMAWTTRADNESKRVIYVGVTRAKRFTALAIPAAIQQRCCEILQRAEVPHQVFEGGNPAR